VPRYVRAAKLARTFSGYGSQRDDSTAPDQPARGSRPGPTPTAGQPATGQAPAADSRLRRAVRFLRDHAPSPAKRKRRRRRLRRLVLLTLSVLLAIILLGSAFGPGTGGLTAGSASGAIGYVDGIPFADAFNATADLGIDPRLVAAVAWVESGFRPEVIDCTVVSDSDPPAKGIMQIQQPTADGLGVDPCIPAQGIAGGARYLLQLRQRFGSWDLAISAYNVGPDALEQAGRVPPNPQYVQDVQTRWNEYMAQFPSYGGAMALSGQCPAPAEGSTEPVPAGNNTLATQLMANSLIACFGRNGHGVGCYDPRLADGALYEHPRGRACDFMMTDGGVAAGHDRARGQAMAEYAAAHASELHVIYVIWFNRVWNPSDGNIGWDRWRDYGCGDCDASGAHYNHVHVSVHLQPGDPPLAHCVPGIACTE
jgi:soluble lytic murein transglycosylase-like protein